ncbi:ZZ-type zinc finger-containing protein 3 [Macrosteles quadrilineatus]|uniref:ZZ-type zinc finger-containing protein 3 n=1 Tax=Macrosteles quadrilineatus TaxID=74068 RepID=UPI0023E19057|nr:ZZ-type zinc finger-containing protein 3 [Macrosteles quadrilineatus]
MAEAMEKDRSQDGSDNSGNESTGSDWYTKGDYGPDEDDIELIKNNSERAFEFQTAAAALKGNSDYRSLLKTLALLEAQRAKTIEDIEKLQNMKRKVVENPREYLRKFVNGESSDIPPRITMAKIPEIDWSKYSVKPTEGDSARETNNPSVSCTKTEEDVTSDVTEEGSDKLTVRGRVYDETKPQTFNQLWTAEEQLRLEELLVEFPPEKKENNRWRKIAQALGNRTTKQVCSRVQKYFKKLNKAGLPIPGHQLKTNYMTMCKKRRKNHSHGRKSTFFPTQHLGAPQLLDGCQEEIEEMTELTVLTTAMKAELIEKILGFKKKDAVLSPYSHAGIKCAGCSKIPLPGTRWRCLVCSAVSLCSDCAIHQLKITSPIHPPSHPLEPLSNPSLTHWDPDYTPDSFKSTNYLDPNFITTNVV